MTQQELDKIVKQHQHWLKKDCEGWEYMRANLSRVDLSGVDLLGANLSGANLSRVDLSGVDLRGANLSGVDLRGVDLSGVDLSRVDLHGVDLHGVDLRGVDLSGACLDGAYLDGAYLDGAYLDEKSRCRLGQILKEPLTGYKKTAEGVVITAEIPAGAIVFCINGKKCRTNKAKITDMGGKELLHSQYDNSFEYTPGKEIVIDDFNLMYNVECASGFHFFRTREEAENY